MERFNVIVDEDGYSLTHYDLTLSQMLTMILNIGRNGRKKLTIHRIA